MPRIIDCDPAVRAVPNRLPGQPTPTAPDRVWVGRTQQSDIAHLPRRGGGWRYLVVWLDRCSCKIVGWNVRAAVRKDFVSEALRQALAVCRPSAELVIHSDQGSQYTATRFKDLPAKHGAQRRMSRRGNCPH